MRLRALGRACANSTWAMLSFIVFNGMVFLLLGLQLPDPFQSLVAAEADPNVKTWMLFTDIILINAQ